MVWQEVSPGIYTCYFENWHVTEIKLDTDVYGKGKYQYVAILEADKVTAKTWPEIKQKILQTKQAQLFEN
jgi:hypothetical protein